MDKVKCCKGCLDRQLGCHVDCEIYRKFTEELAIVKERKRKEREWRSYCMEHYVEQWRKHK